MVSMQVVGGAWVWCCGSCRGKTVVATPRAVIDPGWRGADIEKWAESGGDGPYCPFCGILMHRVMPKSSLTPTLV